MVAADMGNDVRKHRERGNDIQRFGGSGSGKAERKQRRQRGGEKQSAAIHGYFSFEESDEG
jgi:hypothetical protein